MEKKIILYLGSGVMAGVFSGGVLKALAKHDFYTHIEAIHAVSAGAINAAYFLTHQVDLGISIYFEDLTHDFIVPRRIPFAISQRFWHRFVRSLPETKIQNAVDIEYLLDIIGRKKALDITTLQTQPIPLYVKILNIEKCEAEYINIQKCSDPLAVLHAAVSTMPYYFPSRRINEGKYIDAGIKEPIGLPWLLAQYPAHKIVLVLNDQEGRSWGRRIKNTLEGIIAFTMHERALCRLFFQKERSLTNDLSLAKLHKRVLVIRHPDMSPTNPQTTDRKKLVKTAEMGEKAAAKILMFFKSPDTVS